MILIGIDPGFATLGTAILEDVDGRWFVQELWTHTTKAESKKRNVFAVEDNIRRGLETATYLRSLTVRAMSMGVVAGYCCEGMSFPRNSSSAAKMATTWGTLIALSEALAIPILQASPQLIKIELCTDKKATKDDVIAAVAKRCPEIVGLRKPIVRGMWEHAHDAVAAALTCSKDRAIEIARKVA